MSDERYARIGPREVRLMEELAEVIQAISKGVRFGMSDWPPSSPAATNRTLIYLEMRDVVDVWNELASFECLPHLKLDPPEAL